MIALLHLTDVCEGEVVEVVVVGVDSDVRIEEIDCCVVDFSVRWIKVAIVVVVVMVVQSVDEARRSVLVVHTEIGRVVGRAVGSLVLVLVRKMTARPVRDIEIYILYSGTSIFSVA
jgi:hypothetical protein